jgi:integral membrane protein
LRELFTTPHGRFRLVAALEGISFLMLLCIAMPLKYIWGQPQMVQVVGMAHGLLFVLYIYAVVLNRSSLGWNLRQTMLALALSVVPFGTFYVTRRMMREHSRAEHL